jgi:hypothetical protein
MKNMKDSFKQQKWTKRTKQKRKGENKTQNSAFFVVFVANLPVQTSVK